ncbi:MAG: DEAD/DEAH box helicase, partial [Xanthomonadales bacterium]|nr:DEAD/DEAH box helicase [Xanthomonadales bacterium]
MPSDRFSSLPIAAAQVANLESLGYLSMTPIQARCLPLVLAGQDLIAQAKTGSGKTAAFGLGLLEHINPRFFGVQALVLCPTRELADQVGKELRRLARGIPNLKLVLLVGGKPAGPQRASLEQGAHIVVGTPGRVLDHLQRKSLQVEGLKTLVLDEADRMLDMGFADSMAAIVAQAPKDRQTLLFSATYPEEIKRISRSMQRDPLRVSVEEEHAPGVIE